MALLTSGEKVCFFFAKQFAAWPSTVIYRSSIPPFNLATHEFPVKIFPYFPIPMG